MDTSINGDTSRSAPPSFNQSINQLFSTQNYPKPSILVQQTSRNLKSMVRFSCHITFLVLCRDHDLIPKGLTLKDPIGNTQSSKTLYNASLTLLKQQLHQFRHKFAILSKEFDAGMAILKQLLDTAFYSKVTDFHSATSQRCHNQHLLKHKQKFDNLISHYNIPYENPYNTINSFSISMPTFSGLFSKSTPTIIAKNNVIINPVVNLTNQPLPEEETKLLSLGLKVFAFGKEMLSR